MYVTFIVINHVVQVQICQLRPRICDPETISKLQVSISIFFSYPKGDTQTTAILLTIFLHFSFYFTHKVGLFTLLSFRLFGRLFLKVSSKGIFKRYF